jgi:AhpD family alkylhydroperoxidase
MHARMELEEFGKTAEDVANALRSISKAVAASGLDQGLTELIKICASQQNGCAFCTQFHLNAARRLGVPGKKLDLVAVWRDAGIFTSQEKAALAWTEALTALSPESITDEVYAEVKKEFGADKLAFLTSAIATINAWNRIAMAFRFAPPIPQDHANE